MDHHPLLRHSGHGTECYSVYLLHVAIVIDICITIICVTHKLSIIVTVQVKTA